MLRKVFAHNQQHAVLEEKVSKTPIHVAICAEQCTDIKHEAGDGKVANIGVGFKLSGIDFRSRWLVRC